MAATGVQGQESGIRFAIVLWGELSDKCRTLLDCPVLTFADVLAKGHRASASFSPGPLLADQLATIVYTSGTTGNPKVTRIHHAPAYCTYMRRHQQLRRVTCRVTEP